MDEQRELFRKFAEQMTGWPVKDTNIKKISVRAFSKQVKKEIVSDICVGEELNRFLADFNPERVLAIFESNEYLVVTPDTTERNRRVYLFDEKEVLKVEKEA